MRRAMDWSSCVETVSVRGKLPPSRRSGSSPHYRNRCAFPATRSRCYHDPVIVDFHTHIFPSEVRELRQEYIRRDPTFAEMYGDPKAKIATTEELLDSMERSGVDVSVALGFAWRDHETCVRPTDYLLEAAATTGGGVSPFRARNSGASGGSAGAGRATTGGPGLGAERRAGRAAGGAGGAPGADTPVPRNGAGRPPVWRQGGTTPRFVLPVRRRPSAPDFDRRAPGRRTAVLRGRAGGRRAALAGARGHRRAAAPVQGQRLPEDPIAGRRGACPVRQRLSADRAIAADRGDTVGDPGRERAGNGPGRERRAPSRAAAGGLTVAATSPDERPRLFVAVELPDEIRAALAALQG